MILSIARIIADALSPPPFDKERFRLPLPKERRPTTPTKKIDDDVFYDKAFQSHVRKTNDKGSNSTAWEVVKNVEQADISKQRVGEITEKDRLQLSERNLKNDIAIVVKPYWVKRIGRKEAAKMIQQTGIHQRLIGEYYAAFSAALGEKE